MSAATLPSELGHRESWGGGSCGFQAAPFVQHCMCSAQVPKPLRWGVVGAWLTLSVFRPAVGASIFIAVLSAIACCALLGAYALWEKPS